ncbi:MAG: FlgD immunoglobulin-like domain containing protein [bacterium]|nr:FlgD immunoglobulin-like domain containing protein [bacterium]
MMLFILLLSVCGVRFPFNFIVTAIPRLNNLHRSPESILVVAKRDATFLTSDIQWGYPDLAGEFMIDTPIVYIPEGNFQGYANICFGGGNYLLVWKDERRKPDPGDIYGVIVSPAVEFDSSGIVICMEAGEQVNPSAAFGSSNYLVVWGDKRNDNGDIYGARVSMDGQVLDPYGIEICVAQGYQGRPSVAFDGTNYLVTWTKYIPDASDVYGARVSQEGVVLDPNGFVISSANSIQANPRVSFDDTNYLVVWMDKRSGNYDIYCTRVTTAGTVIDSVGIPIETTPAPCCWPSVAFGGSNYMVVWEDQTNQYRPDIYGARVSKDGVVLDTVSIPVSTAPNSQSGPVVAFDGTNYLIAWTDDRDHQWYPHIYAARVAGDGTVLDTLGIRITQAESYPMNRNPSVAFDGINYLVAWDKFRIGSASDIFGSRISVGGDVLDLAGINFSWASNTQILPSVLWDGTNYFAAWQDYRSISTEWDIYGKRMNQYGEFLDTVAIPISTAHSWQYGARVAFDGTNYLTVWMDFRSGFYYSIYGARVSQGGAVLDPAGILIDFTGVDLWYPKVAFGKDRYLVVYDDAADFFPECEGEVYGAMVTPEGNVVAHLNITHHVPYNQGGSGFTEVAFGASNYLVVWHDSRDDGRHFEIYGARISLQGTVLDHNGMRISLETGNKGYPAVGFDGKNYLVVWAWYDPYTGKWGIHGTRVSIDGEVLDPNAIVISSGMAPRWYPVVTFDGTNYLVCWCDQRNVDTDIYGARVTTSGEVLDPGGIPISIQPYDQYAPSIAKGPDDEFFITWYRFTPAPYSTERVWGLIYTIPGIEETTTLPICSPYLYIRPNPFGQSTVISYQLPETRGQKSEVRLSIYDLAGRLVKSFARLKPYHTVTISWDGTDDSGNRLPSGIYFCKLQVGDENLTKQVLLLR